MTTTRKLTTIAAALIACTGLSAPSFAEDDSRLPFDSEVNSCIAAVNASLELETASRVRHLVKQQQRNRQSYAFAIETSVFSGDAERRYEAYCVARGGDAPTQFRITEETA